MLALPPGKSQLSSVEDLVTALREKRYEEDFLVSSIECLKDAIGFLVNGRTVLSYAVETPYIDCVCVLLQYSHPSTIDKPDATGRTALSYAATAEDKHDRPSFFRSATASYDKHDRPSFFRRATASNDKHKKPVFSILAAGDHKPEGPWKKIMKLLIDENADPRSRDQTGRTPLSWAAGMGCKETVQLFCDKYKEDDAVFAADHGGRSPVSYAAQAGHDYIVKTIFKTKRNYDDCDHENRTPLYWFLQGRWKDDQAKNVPISDDAMNSYLPPDLRLVDRDTMRPKLSDQGIAKILNQSVKGKMTLLSEAVMHDDEYAVEALMSIPHFTYDAINEEGGETALILALRYDRVPLSKLIWDNLGETIRRSHGGRYLFPHMSRKGLSQTRQCLRVFLELLLQYTEVEKIEQLLGSLIGRLLVPPNELNWVIDCESSLQETVANIKQIRLVNVLLEHGIDPAILCLTEKWFHLRPTEVKGSLQFWQLPEPRQHSTYRTKMQEDVRRMIDGLPEPTEEQAQSLEGRLFQKNQHTHGIKIRNINDIEHIYCCENSKTTILAHNERDAWAIFSDGKREGSFESRTCHATFSIILEFTESSSMSSHPELKQTLWGIQWTIPHNKQHHPFYNSSLSKIWIPEGVSEFLKQFLEEFDEEWERYCDSTESHLVEHRRKFAQGISDSKHINNLGRDLLYLAHLRRTFHHQVKTIEAEIKRYYSTVTDNDREDRSRSLQSRLRSIKQYYTEKLDRFEHTINSISQMEYTRQSIHEATFMRRISVVTFVYLPLMFTASLFGMNVNATEGFPGWQWFLPFAAGFWGLTYLLWEVSGQSATEIKIALESFKRPWRITHTKNKLGDSV